MMAGTDRHKAIRIFLYCLLFIVLLAGSGIIWLTACYKRIVIERLPGVVMKGSDSIYYASIKDININLFKHRIYLSGVKFWADTLQVNALRAQGRYAPNTVSFLEIPQ